MDGLSQFGDALGQLDSDGLSLPQETTRFILDEARKRNWSFDDAWAAAINRLQPSAAGGTIDGVLESDLRETRAILEECRPHFRAAYEGREPTVRECAEEVVTAWGRLDGEIPVHHRDDYMTIRSNGNGHHRR